MSTWDGFVDDHRPLDAPPLDSPHLGARAVRDTDLTAAPSGRPLRVVLTGGAAQLARPVAVCLGRGLPLASLDTALRDTADLPGGAQRVVAAYWDAGLPDDALLHVRVPGPWSPTVPAALDVLAEVEAVVVALGPAEYGEGPWVEEVLRRELRLSLVGGTAAQAAGAAREHGRRGVVSWLTEDTEAALAGLGDEP